MRVLYFDGSCGPDNPGLYASYGWHLNVGENEIAYGYGTLPNTADNTNNTAEYWGLISGLKAVLTAGYTRIEVRGDSKLAINQASGKWNCNNERLRTLLKQVNLLKPFFDSIEFVWGKREGNRRADYLAGKALAKLQNKELPFAADFKKFQPKYKIIYRAYLEDNLFEHPANSLTEAYIASRALVSYKPAEVLQLLKFDPIAGYRPLGESYGKGIPEENTNNVGVERKPDF